MVTIKNRTVWLSVIVTVVWFACLTSGVPVAGRYRRSTHEEDTITHDASLQGLSIGAVEDSPALGADQNGLTTDEDPDQSQFQQQSPGDLDHGYDHDMHHSDALLDGDTAQSGGSRTGSQISHSVLQPYDGDSQITIDDHDNTDIHDQYNSEETDIGPGYPDSTYDIEGQHPGPAHEETDSLHHGRRDLDNTTENSNFLLTGRGAVRDKEHVISTDGNQGFLLDHGIINGVHPGIQNGSIDGFTDDHLMSEQVTSAIEARQDVSEPEATTSGLFNQPDESNDKGNLNNNTDVSHITGEETESGEQHHSGSGNHVTNSRNQAGSGGSGSQSGVGDGGTEIDKNDGSRHNHGGGNLVPLSTTQNTEELISTTSQPVYETNTPRLAILPTPSQTENGESQNISDRTTTPQSVINGQVEIHSSGNDQDRPGTESTEQSTERPQDGHVISGEGHIGTGGEEHEGPGGGNEETGHKPNGQEGSGEENHGSQCQEGSTHEGHGNEGSGNEGQGQEGPGHEGQGGGTDHDCHGHIEGSGTDEENTGHKDDKDNSKAGAYIDHTTGVPFPSVEPGLNPTTSSFMHESIKSIYVLPTIESNYEVHSSRASETIEPSNWYEPVTDTIQFESFFNTLSISETVVTKSILYTPIVHSSPSQDVIIPTNSYISSVIETPRPGVIQSSEISERSYTSESVTSSTLVILPTASSIFTSATTYEPFTSELPSSASSIVKSSSSVVSSTMPSSNTLSSTTEPSTSKHIVTEYSTTTTSTTTESAQVDTDEPRTESTTTTSPGTSPETSTTPSTTTSTTPSTTTSTTSSTTTSTTSSTTTSTTSSTTTSTTPSATTSTTPSATPSTEPSASTSATTSAATSSIPSAAPSTTTSGVYTASTTVSSSTGYGNVTESPPTRSSTTTVRSPLLTIGPGTSSSTMLTTDQTTRLTTVQVTKKHETDKPTEKPDVEPTSGRPSTLPGQQTSQSTTTAAMVTVTTLRPITTRPPYTVTDKTQGPQHTTPPPMFIQIEIRMTWQEFCSMKTNFIASLQEIIRTEKQVIVRDEQFKIQNLPKQYCSMANAIVQTDNTVTSRSITLQLYIVDDAGKINIQLTYDVSSVIGKGFQDTVFKDKIVAVRVVQHQTSVDQQVPEASARQRESSVTMVIIIASVGGVCCLILIILQLILIHRRITTKSKQRALQKLSNRSLDNVALGAMPKSRPHSGYWNPALEDDDEFESLEYSHVLNYSTLANFCTDSNSIYDEFQDVPCDNAGLTKLFVGEDDKNRFANVLPHSHSRVKLNKREGDTSDYINASYIKGCRGTLDTYIATQSPLVNTVEDFWRMVWEQQSRSIIMLNPKLPSSKYKQSTCYWPDNLATDSFRQYGDYTVSLKKRDVQKDYVECTLEVMDIERNLKRGIHHFLLTCWTDTGTPEPLSIVKFVLDTRPYYENNGTPAIVHCGPGTGRTGVLIALDICMRTYEKKKHVDVFNCVYRLRKDRLGMVQTREQYSLIYQALNQYAVILGSPSFSTRSSVISLHAML